MNQSKRNLLFVPEINRNTFVFFYFEGGEDSRSYSIRDYSDPTRTALTHYANKFRYPAGEILHLARREGNYCFPAKPPRVEDVSFWHSEILKANRQFLNTFQQDPGKGTSPIRHDTIPAESNEAEP